MRFVHENRWIVAAVTACALCVPGLARGQSVVFESYPGDRPGDADQLLAPLMAELESRDFLAGPGVLGKRIELRMSRSGHVLSSKEIATARRLVDDGWSKWISGNFRGASADMKAALDLYRSAPATIARDQSLRDPVLRALVGYALANKRLGNTAAATSAMAEVLRSYPDRGIDRTMFGPEAKRFYNDVAEDLRRAGTGTLRIDVDDANAVVFLNGRYVTLGSTTQSDLFPGRYRVYLQRGESAGRVHVVDVEAGGSAALSVTWGVEGTLRTRHYVGFQFRGSADQERHEARYATSVARALGATGVVVVRIGIVDGRRVIEGSVLLLDTGRTLRRAYLPIEPVMPNASQVRSLALFLAGEGATKDLVVVGSKRDAPRDRDAPPSHERPYRVWKWLALGAGTAALATGIYLMSIDGDCSTGEPPAGASCAEVYETRTPGIGATVGGAVLVGTGFILWLKDDPNPSEPRRAATVVPTRGGVMVGFGGTF